MVLNVGIFLQYRTLVRSKNIDVKTLGLSEVENAIYFDCPPIYRLGLYVFPCLTLKGSDSNGNTLNPSRVPLAAYCLYLQAFRMIFMA